jgi:hypothetical protein
LRRVATAGLLGDDVGFGVVATAGTAGLLGDVASLGFVAFLQKIIRDMFAKYKEGSNKKLRKMLEYG